MRHDHPLYIPAVLLNCLSLIVVTSLLSGCEDEAPILSTPTIHQLPITSTAAPQADTNTLSQNTINDQTSGTTTLGTRRYVADTYQPRNNQMLTTWTKYERPSDFARAITLPLQLIPLKNGQKAAVYVTVPATPSGQMITGQFPTILSQTPYNSSLGNISAALIPHPSLGIGGADHFLVKRGYVHVSADIYGTGLSDGGWLAIGQPEQDVMAEVLAWTLQQPWSNGKIGLAGTSYLGISSLLTAAQKNPNQNNIKAVFAVVPMGDAKRQVVGIGGQINALFISKWIMLTHLTTTMVEAAIGRYPALRAYLTNVKQQHIDQIDKFFTPLFSKALSGDPEIRYDSDFWAQRSPIEQAKQIQAPVFLIGANKDIFQRDVPLLYEQIKGQTNTKMIITDGTHTDVALAGQSSIPIQGIDSFGNLMLRWFDHYLKGIPTDVEKLPNVTQVVTGYQHPVNGRFALNKDWPHPEMRTKKLYLHTNQQLLPSKPTTQSASLTFKIPDPATLRYGRFANDYFYGDLTIRDRSDCSLSYAQWALGLVLPAQCHRDSSVVEKNALNFETPTLSEPLYLNGPLMADIWVSSNKTDASIAVRIDDVSPTGTVKSLTTGLMTASMRKIDPTRSRFIQGELLQPWHTFAQTDDAPLTPNQPVNVQVEILPIAALIAKGHKLRVSITATNQAMGIFDQIAQTRMNGAVQTLYFDAARPSAVVLPIVSINELP